MIESLEAYLDRLKQDFNLTYELIQYLDRSFYHIKLIGLILKQETLDLSDLLNGVENIDLNLDFVNCVLEKSYLILPSVLNMAEFVNSNLIETNIVISPANEHVPSSRVLHGNSPIIGINKTSMDSLSTFDRIKVPFILQCVESNLECIHTSFSLPEHLVILGINSTRIQSLGTIRTNSSLQLLSVEMESTEDDLFVVEIFSKEIIKIRIMGPASTTLVGTLRFFVETPDLYFLDLIDFHMVIHYDPNPLIHELISNLTYFQLPSSVEVDEKMVALFRLLNVPFRTGKMVS